jgi:exodeoxyribonuclease VII large subunit
MISGAARESADNRRKLAEASARLDLLLRQRLLDLSQRLEALDRTRQTLGYGETLRRGYAVVRGDSGVLTSRAMAETATGLEIEFHDGRLAIGGRAAPRKGPSKPPEQGSLF